MSNKKHADAIHFRFTQTSSGTSTTGTSTVSVGPLIASQGNPAFFYNKAIVGYSVTANSGTWGIRMLTYNPAAPNITSNAIISNAGNTGVGASSGFLTMNAMRTGFDNSVVNPGITAGNYSLGFAFPSVIEFSRTGAATGSITVVIDGQYYND